MSSVLRQAGHAGLLDLLLALRAPLGLRYVPPKPILRWLAIRKAKVPG